MVQWGIVSLKAQGERKLHVMLIIVASAASGEQCLETLWGDDGETAGYHRAFPQFQHQLDSTQQGPGAAVASHLEKLLVVPVEAGGKLAVRVCDGFDQGAAGPIAVGDRLLVFRE